MSDERLQRVEAGIGIHEARIRNLEESRVDHEERLRKAEDRDAWLRTQMAELKIGQDNQVVLLKEIKNGQDAQWRRIDSQGGRQERLEEQVKGLQKDQDRAEKRGDVQEGKVWKLGLEVAKWSGWLAFAAMLLKAMFGTE